MSYIDYIGMVPAEYTDEELIKIKNELEAEYSEIVADWAEDVKNLSSDKFDPYSFFGERKLKKIADKYADQSADITIILEDIERELSLRENYNEEQKYLNSNKVKNSKMSTEEFIQKESMKTLKHKLENETKED